MARESCNLDKDEAEILKPSSSPSSPRPPPPPRPPSPPTPASSSSSSPPALFLQPPHAQDHLHPDVANPHIQNPEHQSQQQPEPPPTADSGISTCTRKRKEAKEDGHHPPNRCSSCRRKVGLTAFRCRCGDLFCPRHRYSDVHDCSFDYKAAGREEIAKANPVIKAAKIIKI